MFFSAKNLVVVTVEKHLTSYGGVGLLSIFFKKIQLKKALTNIFNAIVEKSNRTIPIYNRVLMFLLTVMIGGDRFSHMSQIGNYKVIREVFDIDKICMSSSTLTRLFNKIKTFAQAVKINKGFVNYLYQLIPFKEIEHDWLSFDSSVITKYGEQEGALIGYNPKKPGRPSYHPIIAFLNYSRYVVNLWNRSGNCKSGNNILNFFNDVYTALKNHIHIDGIIADTGFYIQSFFEHLEELKLDYQHKNGLPKEDYIDFCSNADLVIHDAQYTDDEYKFKKGWGHTTFSSAVNLGIKASADRLGLFHHDPDHTDNDIDEYVNFCRNKILEANKEIDCFAVKEGMEILL